jgi:hypothetical protein
MLGFWRFPLILSLLRIFSNRKTRGMLERAAMKKISGHIPEPYEEEEEAEFRAARRYFRKKPPQKKPRRWQKSRQTKS